MAGLLLQRAEVRRAQGFEEWESKSELFYSNSGRCFGSGCERAWVRVLRPSGNNDANVHVKVRLDLGLNRRLIGSAPSSKTIQ